MFTWPPVRDVIKGLWDFFRPWKKLVCLSQCNWKSGRAGRDKEAWKSLNGLLSWRQPENLEFVAWPLKMRFSYVGQVVPTFILCAKPSATCSLLCIFTFGRNNPLLTDAWFNLYFNACHAHYIYAKVVLCFLMRCCIAVFWIGTYCHFVGKVARVNLQC